MPVNPEPCNAIRASACTRFGCCLANPSLSRAIAILDPSRQAPAISSTPDSFRSAHMPTTSSRKCRLSVKQWPAAKRKTFLQVLIVATLSQAGWNIVLFYIHQTLGGFEFLQGPNFEANLIRLPDQPGTRGVGLRLQQFAPSIPLDIYL